MTDKYGMMAATSALVMRGNPHAEQPLVKIVKQLRIFPQETLTIVSVKLTLIIWNVA